MEKHFGWKAAFKSQMLLWISSLLIAQLCWSRGLADSILTFTGHTGGDKVKLSWKHNKVPHWTIFLSLTQKSLNWAVSRLNDYLAWASDSDIKSNGEPLVPKIFLRDGQGNHVSPLFTKYLFKQNSH